MRDYEGTLWTQDVQWSDIKVTPEQWGIRKLISLDEPGLSKKQGVIHRGGNSAYQALNLALLLGAERVIFIGLDLMMTGMQRHWFGEHPEHMNASSNYSNFIRDFQTIDPKAYGLEIWNCSRRTALNHFACHDLDEVLSHL